MGSKFSPEKIQQMKAEALKDMGEAIDEFRRDFPKVADGAAAAVGSALGGAASYTALYVGGTTGLSAVGITSGLATAGSVVGGGMVAGIGLLAAPVAVLGVVGYAIAKKRRNARLAVALDRAIEKLYRVQERLIANAEHFRKELAEIKAYISEYENSRPK